MTPENKQTFLDLGRKLISDLTQELNTELAKLKTDSSQADKDDVFVNCDGIIARLNSRLNQLKKQTQ